VTLVPAKRDLSRRVFQAFRRSLGTNPRTPILRTPKSAPPADETSGETAAGGQVAIIGVGGVLPGAHSFDQFFRNNLHQRCFIRDVPPWLWEQDVFYSPDKSLANSTYATVAALIEDPDLDLSSFRIPPAVSAMVSRSQKLALICARTALRDAGLLDNESFDRDRTAVIMAAIGGGNLAAASGMTLSEELIFDRLKKIGDTNGVGSTINDLIGAYEEKYPRFTGNEDTLVGTSPNLVAGRIASAFDLHGTNLTLDAACASSLAAIGTAVNSLQTGDSDLVITGGVDTWIDIGAFVGFAQLTALASKGCFPFEARAEGLVLGEGCGVVVLKRLDDALRDGNDIYSVIRGVGSSSDGSGQGITVPSSDGQVCAMQRAYDLAGFDANSLDYIECHGTGTAVGDPVELSTIQRILAEAPGQRHRSLPVASVKASVGHLRTAAGMAGLFNAMNVVQHRVVPPQTNFETPTAEFDWDQGNVHVPVTAESLHDGEIRVGVSAWGFGGTNYHLALSSPPRQAKAPRFDVSEHLLPCVPKTDSDIAFLFPGQGSQYVGMLAEESKSEIGREFLSRADSIVQQMTGTRLSDVIYQDERSSASEARLQATEIAQPAILTMSAILLEMVRNEGIQCSMAVGHSLGEYTALYASGVISFEEAIRTVTQRGQLMNQPEKNTMPSGMVSLLGPPEDTESLLQSFDGSVVRASINSYDQLVVAAPLPELELLCEEAGRRGLHAQPLGVDRGFHSKFVSHAVAPLRVTLRELVLRQASILVPANVSRQIYPRCDDPTQSGQPMAEADRARVIDLLAGQTDQPVDFVSQIEVAYRAGIRRFVEIGPSRILTGLVGSMLQGKSFQNLALDESGHAAFERVGALRRSLASPLQFQRQQLAGLKQTNLTTVATPIIDLSNLPLADHIRAVVAAVTGYDEAQLGDGVKFGDLGIDSLKVVEVVSRLRGKVLPHDYRGFRNLTSVGEIISEARDSGLKQVVNPAELSSGIQCYLNREVPVVRTSAPLLPEGEWFVEASASAQAALTNIKTSQFPGVQRMAIWQAVDSVTLCTHTLPNLLESVVSMANEMAQAGASGRFALITFGDDQRQANYCFRALSGFIRSAALEINDIDFSYHHVDAEDLDSESLQLCLADGGIGRRLDPRQQLLEAVLEPLDDLLMGTPETVLGPTDLVLVTGGARGIASVVVQRLLARVPSRFLLLGQRPEVEPWIVEHSEGRIEYLSADITDTDAVSKLQLAERGVTLVIHAAGINDSETPLNHKHPEDFKRVLATKILGLENVLAHLAPPQLRGIVQFSSIVAHFGNLAQADYAAANGFLDGFTLPSVPVLSIGWTAWDEVGMAQRGLVRQILETSGIELLPLDQGIEIFESLLTWWLTRPSEPSTHVQVFGDLGVSLAKETEARTSHEEQSGEDVVIVNPAASGIPVFMICGVYGHAHRLVLLAQDASSDIPFYALQPPQMDWSTASATTLLDMAAWYANQIEALRPSGPIALLGTSFGGNVVFEIATMLQERNRQVELLAIVDSMPPEEDPLEFDALSERLKHKRTHATDPIEFSGIDVANVHLSALREHLPQSKFRGSIQYYLATEMGRPSVQDRRFSWDNYATDGMAIVPTSGQHGGFGLMPTRKEIADHISRSLTHNDAATLDVDAYHEAYVSHSLIVRDNAEWVRLPDHSELPITEISGRWMLESAAPFQNRLFIEGRALDAWTDDATKEIAVFYNDQLVCVTEPSCALPDHNEIDESADLTQRFALLVDFHTLPDSERNGFRVIALGASDANEIGQVNVPAP